MTVPSAYWIQTLDGGVYDYSNPAASTPIDARTIAHSLCRMRRYLSHSRRKWTVGQHSIFVMDLGLSLLHHPADKNIAAPYLLLHDAHEAFVGDMPAPLKKYISDQYGFKFKHLEIEADARIRHALKIDIMPPAWVSDLIAECDICALKIERDKFLPSKHEWVIDEVKLPREIAHVTPRFTSISTASLTRVFKETLEANLKLYHETSAPKR